MASLFYMPFRPAYDSAGVSVPGAQAWFTLEGTNTPSSVYADSGLTTPLANPLPANGVGKFPTAYMNPAISYRVRIYGRTAEVGVSTPLEEMDPYSTSLFDTLFYAATRTDLAALSTTAGPAFLTEAGREGTFVWSGANLSAQVAADTAQGIYVAPASAPTGASGAWVRKSDNAPSVAQDGTVADNATNDAPAVAAALSLAKALALTGFGYSIGAGRVRIPKGTNAYYQGTTTHNVYATTRIEGDSVGEAGGASTVMRWGNATGFIVQRYNTTGDTGTDGTAAGTRGGDASIISGLFLKGSYAGTEGSYHGAYLRARASLRDMTFDSWPGDAIRIDADSAGAFGVPVGNANNFEISRAFAQYCRNGIYARGGDVNVGVITGFSAIACRQFGVLDEGFLGSVYIGAHTAANGLAGDGTAAHPASAATYLGNRFSVKVGQEAGASTNAPPATATSNTWWWYWQAGGAATGIVAWVSGLNWRAGGGYCTTSASAQHVFLGCYSEMDQPPSQFSQNSLIIGGLHGAPVVGGGYIRANQNFVQVNKFWSEGYAKFDWPQTDIGPQSGAAADNLIGLNTTNVSSKLAGISWAAGVSQADGYLQFNRTVNGTVIQGASVVIVGIGGAFPATFDANGLTLATGKNLYVNSVQVVSARDTGWTADTGTAKKTATAAYVVGTGLTVGAAYVQAEVTAIITRQALVEAALRDATQEIKALKDALIAHGLIGA